MQNAEKTNRKREAEGVGRTSVNGLMAINNCCESSSSVAYKSSVFFMHGLSK